VSAGTGRKAHTAAVLMPYTSDTAEGKARNEEEWQKRNNRTVKKRDAVEEGVPIVLQPW